MNAARCATHALVFLFVSVAHAQYTEGLNGGISRNVQTMHVDTLQDRILIAGSFAYANSIQVSPGVLEYSNNTYQNLGCGVAWDCSSFINEAGLGPNSSQTVTTWQGDVYLGGDWSFTRDGVLYDHIMRWDGVAWHPLGAGCDGKVKSIRVINDQLIVAGWFTYADTVLANGLARWDGVRWHKVVEVPPFYIGGGPNQLEDVNWYQDTWYIGGNLPLTNDLARWNGNAWEMVDGGFTSAFSQVNSLEVHADKLYIAGSFARCLPLGNGQDPGTGVVAWDGAQWDDLGGGTCGSTNGAVFDIRWIDEELYAVGIFNRIGGQPCGKVAKWNGTEWCPLVPENYWGSGNLGDIVSYRDTLYIGGAFNVAGNEETSSFVRWTGGDHTEGCGALVSVGEHELVEDPPLFHPNPAGDRIVIEPTRLKPGAWVRLTDATGRTVYQGPLANDGVLDVQALRPGPYLVHMHHRANAVPEVQRLLIVR